jgi:UDP-glucose 4-epimerase
MSRRILVTGGAGFIGSHLVERLLSEGDAVTVVDDLSTGSLENLARCQERPGFRLVSSTVSDCPKLSDLAGESDGIVHLAAAVGVELVVKSPIRTIETNLKETEAILAAASVRRVPVLVASTSEVYGKSSKPAFAEEDDLLIGPPHLGRWSYACSKLMDEFLAMAYAAERGLPVTVARLFNTVGPRQTGRYGMVLPRFISAAQAGTPLRVFGNGDQTRCFCYVDDTVEALLRLLKCPTARGEVFNVGSDQEITIRGLADRVIRLLRSNSQVEFVPYDEAYAPGFEDMQRRRPVLEKLHRHTGFLPATTLDQIIERTAGTR